MILHAHVTHHIPGRVRVKLPQAKGDPELLREIQNSISPLPGVKNVSINSATGSLLVNYVPGAHEDFHRHLCNHGEQSELFALQPPEITEADEIASKIEAEAELLSAHSETAQSIVNFVKQIDEGVKEISNNMVDLKVLLPLGLAAYAFFKMSSHVATPLWVTLGIFSFNSFVRLHHPVTTVHTEQHEVVVPKELVRKRQVATKRGKRA